MPRRLSRITLEVEAVKVERLQQMSVKDARKEGVVVWESDRLQRGELAPCRDFSDSWDSHAKPGSKWKDNPWVWVVTFKRIDTTEGQG